MCTNSIQRFFRYRYNWYRQESGISWYINYRVGGITEDGARYLLANDVAIIERELSAAHPCVELLSENRVLVLLNMAFNLGMPRLRTFYKTWDAIHKKDYDVAAEQMLDSRWAKQVKGFDCYCLASGSRNYLVGIRAVSYHWNIKKRNVKCLLSYGD